MEKVTINVGGCLFETTQKTMMKIPALSSINWKEQEFSVFIDRDPYPFSFILSYLRNGYVPPVDEVTLNVLILECDYYKLQNLKDVLLNRECSHDPYLFVLTQIRESLSKLL